MGKGACPTSLSNWLHSWNLCKGGENTLYEVVLCAPRCAYSHHPHTMIINKQTEWLLSAFCHRPCSWMMVTTNCEPSLPGTCRAHARCPYSDNPRVECSLGMYEAWQVSAGCTWSICYILQIGSICFLANLETAVFPGGSPHHQPYLPSRPRSTSKSGHTSRKSP